MNRSLNRTFLFTACFFAFVLACQNSFSLSSNNDQHLVRIAILRDVDSVLLSIRGRYEIVAPSMGILLSEGRKLRAQRVVPTAAGILIGEEEYPYDQVRILAKKDVKIRIGKKDCRYRGQMDIQKTKEGKLLLINSLGIEEYVKGVLYHEVSHRWPLEAIKAQAVAARTYVLYRMKEYAEEPYDVTSDIYSQVYGGRSAERYRTNIAANRTKGLILLYNKKILPAYFHANCGGHTEDVDQLWGENIPPLKGHPCNFCLGLPHSHWKRNYRLKDFQERLNENGIKIGLIKNIEILGRNVSGRIKNLRITDRKGKSITISGRRFRDIIGPNEIKSNNYEITMKGYYADLVGKGWGHGVGMCQWGAYQMAKERYAFDQILNFYYPTAEMIAIKDVDLDVLLKPEEKDKKKKKR